MKETVKAAGSVPAAFGVESLAARSDTRVDDQFELVRFSQTLYLQEIVEPEFPAGRDSVLQKVDGTGEAGGVVVQGG